MFNKSFDQMQFKLYCQLSDDLNDQLHARLNNRLSDEAYMRFR